MAKKQQFWCKDCRHHSHCPDYGMVDTVCSQYDEYTKEEKEALEIEVTTPLDSVFNLKESKIFYCPVCKAKAELDHDYGHVWIVTCPRCDNLEFTIKKKRRSVNL